MIEMKKSYLVFLLLLIAAMMTGCTSQNMTREQSKMMRIARLVNDKNNIFTENVTDKEKSIIFARLFEKVNIGTIIRY